jgi:hypothetical protein
MRGLVSLMLICLPLCAQASPWTLPPGTMVFSGRYDFAVADEEFLDDRKAQVYSLGGQFQASTYALGARFGAAKGLEFQFDLPIKQVSYTADPVILLGGEMTDLDFFQENIINLNRSASGLGDLRLAGRYQLFQRQWVGTVQVGAKIPTGYERPKGTFGTNPESREEFLARVGEFVRPDRVSDDVTLGDGQVDLDVGFLLGWASSKGTFLRLDSLFRLRLGGAGDQVVGSFRVGQRLGKRMMFYVGFDGEYTVTDGDLIGVSVAAEDPTLPANEYGGLNNLLLRELRLERDQASIPVGLIVRITDVVEVNGSWANVFWGRNTSAANIFSLGVGLRTGS